MKIDMNLDLGAAASAEDWVKNSRIKEKEAKAEAKRLAELKKNQLEEEEDELLEQSSSMYNSSHLKGLRVMHAARDFEEGQEVILTLKDTGLLEKDEDGKILGLNEEGDVLENVNIADKDRRVERETKKRRLNQPVYSALDDYEFQDGVATGSRAPLLPQYEREKKAAPKFELGDGGVAAFDPEAAAAARAAASAAKIESLLTMSKSASDFYSATEYVAFAKGKKRDKKNKAFRKKSADEDEDEAPKETLADSGAAESKEMDVDGHDNGTSAPTKVTPKVLAPIKFQSIDLDEDDPDLAQALARSRRLALQTRPKEGEQDGASTAAAAVVPVEDRGAAIARALAAKIETIRPQQRSGSNLGVDQDDDDINVDGRRPDGTLVFNSTTEFSTRLQAHLNEKARAKTEALMRGLERGRADEVPASANKSHPASQPTKAGRVADDQEDDESVGGEEKKESKGEEADISGTMEDFEGLSDMGGSDMEVDSDEQGDEDDGVDGDDQLGFVHHQPLVAKGMAATLALLKSSGELKRADQLAGRAKDSRQYDPSSTDLGVKLEYRDEFGRKLTQKEAFRQLSYKFHGYGPSQKKKEKRLKALELQNKAQSSRAGILEGAAGTMKSLTQAQEATGKAHITIQGGATSAGVAPLQVAAMIAKKKGTASSVKK